MYNKITLEEIAALRAIVGEENVLLGDEINPDYAHDELGDVSHMPAHGGIVFAPKPRDYSYVMNK